MLMKKICRRIGLAVAASLLTVGLAANAAAPLAKTNAPGFYRMMLGDFEITALSDGTTNLEMDKLLTNITPEQLQAGLAHAHLSSPVEASFNGFLINTGTKLVLVDSGAGSLFGPTLGNLVKNLKASGYQPDQVDEVYITHMHPDHVGGLVADGQMVFPNAVVRATQAEADYWLSQANLDKAPAANKGFFQGAMASLNPYVAAGKFKPFSGAVELVPGITSQPSAGHTAGHSSYVVQSHGQKLVLIGDLIHLGAIQFGNPSVTIAFDTDSKLAEAERKKQFADAAKQGYLLGAAHISFPGIFHLQPQGKGYEYLPVTYSQIH